MTNDSPMKDKTCANCGRALLRGPFSFKKYGNYHCALECCLPQKERTPYRQYVDTCKEWISKDDKKS